MPSQTLSWSCWYITRWFGLRIKPKQRPYLHNRAQLIMVGHEHIAKFAKVSSASHERLDLSSGATNPPEEGQLYRHTYNWIEISVQREGETLELKIEVFARAWMPDIADFAPDYSRMGGVEPATFHIACPKLVPLAATSPMVAPLSHMLTGVDVADSATIPIILKGGATMQPSNDDVAQLRFLFWRHLDWQQRLKVLVDADVLPASPDKPVSQNLERMAIERAQAEGKLADVWDAMMPLLPAGKQLPNPFRESKEQA